MTSSVDDAVFDYFSLLLTEPAEETEAELLSAPVKDKGSAKIEKKVVNNEANNLVAEERSPQLQRQKVVRQLQPTQSTFSNEHIKQNSNIDKQALERLLEPVFKEAKAEVTTQTRVESKLNPIIKEKSSPQVSVSTKIDSTAKISSSTAAQVTSETVAEVPPSITKGLVDTLDDEFQVLYFKVAGLTLAVPLVSLGGIIKVEKINYIMGRPKWYKGVQQHRDSQLNIVDTCAWVMPEKYDEKLAKSVDYQYIVVLEDSNWGLTCESLVNSVRILKSEVNWREKVGKRPWLAGVVREQMCGILHVQALIELLNAGLGSQDPVG